MSKTLWRTFTLRFSDLTAAATQQDFHLFELGTDEILEKVRIKHPESFRGGALTAYTVSVGVPGDLTKYGSAFDVFQEVLPRNLQLTNVLGGVEENQRASIRVQATATGGNLSLATQGTVEIAIYTSRP